MELRTERLRLRSWQDDDRAPFAALNADPEVVRWFPAPLARAESDALAARIAAELEQRGWGLWALQERTTGRFLGFTGLNPVGFEADFAPAVEVGWRLARWAWGRGYATEAAHAAVAFAFGELALDEVVSFAAAGNARSIAVMERLGMSHDPADDFDHPLLPAGDPLRRHVLYRAVRRAGPWPLLGGSCRGGGAFPGQARESHPTPAPPAARTSGPGRPGAAAPQPEPPRHGGGGMPREREMLLRAGLLAHRRTAGPAVVTESLSSRNTGHETSAVRRTWGPARPSVSVTTGVAGPTYASPSQGWQPVVP